MCETRVLRYIHTVVYCRRLQRAGRFDRLFNIHRSAEIVLNVSTLVNTQLLAVAIENYKLSEKHLL